MARRDIVRRRVWKTGVQTLTVDVHGRFWMHLQNRTNDTEYEVAPNRVPLWLAAFDRP